MVSSANLSAEILFLSTIPNPVTDFVRALFLPTSPNLVTDLREVPFLPTFLRFSESSQLS